MAKINKDIAIAGNKGHGEGTFHNKAADNANQPFIRTPWTAEK